MMPFIVIIKLLIITINSINIVNTFVLVPNSLNSISSSSSNNFNKNTKISLKHYPLLFVLNYNIKKKQEVRSSLLRFDSFSSSSSNSISRSISINTNLKSKPTDIVDVDYEYDDEDEENIVSSTNRTKFNVITLPDSSSNKIAEIESFDLPTSYIIPILNDKKYVMIDVPPYSNELYNNIQSFIGNNAELESILITNQNSIYYNNDELTDESNYYTQRQSDLSNWKSVYPDINVVMHRIDIPRDSKSYITQVLDGYGPFAYDTNTNKFIETGKPLTVIKWDDDLLQSFIEQDISEEETNTIEKQRKETEQNTSIIAMYTPGHTSGSICYIFTKLKLCCSGFTVPVENVNDDQQMEKGIRLDYKGYITTNKGGLKRQVDSVYDMMNMYGKEYIDTILPSRGGIYYLPASSSSDDDADSDDMFERKMEALKDVMEKFQKVGEIYESLGI